MILKRFSLPCLLLLLLASSKCDCLTGGSLLPVVSTVISDKEALAATLGTLRGGHAMLNPSPNHGSPCTRFPMSWLPHS